MDYSFWDQNWKEGHTNWHLNQVNGYVIKFFSQIPSRERAKKSVLLPLCGASWDLKWLADEGFITVGVEWCLKPLEDFCKQHYKDKFPQTTADGSNFEFGNLKLCCGDFFTYQPSSPFDYVLDRAALIAIAPENRKKYCDHLQSLLKPKGQILLQTFEHDWAGGPPHALFLQDINELFSENYTIKKLKTKNVSDLSPGLAKAGATYFTMVTYLLTKLN